MTERRLRERERLAVRDRGTEAPPCPLRSLPISVDRDTRRAAALPERRHACAPARCAAPRSRRRRSGWFRSTPASSASAARAAGRQRYARRVDLGGDARRLAELGEIARRARRRHPCAADAWRAHGLSDGVARLRHQIAVRQVIAAAAGREPPLSASRGRACAAAARAPRRRSCRSPSPGRPARAPARRTILPCGTAPNTAIEIVIGPGVRTVSPPSSGQPKRSASAPSPRANALEPRVADRLRQREREQKAQRPRTLGGEVGQVHAQRLPGDRLGGSSGKKCTPPTMRVGLEHEVAARRRRDRRGIVDERRRRRDASPAA